MATITMYKVYKAIQDAMIEDADILAEPFDIDKLKLEDMQEAILKFTNYIK